jgi:hypothetical protein
MYYGASGNNPSPAECLEQENQAQTSDAGPNASQISLLPGRAGCTLLTMSFRPVHKIAGIGNVFLGTELVDIAEYDLEIYEENPEDHQHHGANWTPGAQKIEGTVVGELPIRKDLRLLTEEGYSVKFYLRDTFGSVVILDPILDSSGNLSSRRYSLSDGLHLAESIICRSRFAPKRSVGNPYSCRC